MARDRVVISADEVRSAGRKQVVINGQPVVVFSMEDGFVAYRDACPHQGGPVCSRGSLHPFLTARVGDDGRPEERFENGAEAIIACPWHGWEFWVETGRAVADASKSLSAAHVVSRGDQLIVTL